MTTIRTVVRMIDGAIAPSPCAREKCEQICAECIGRRCETRIIMREVRNAVVEVLDHTTLADACKKSDAEHALNYEI